MAGKMPREIAPGVFWIGDCLAQRHKGKVYHGYNAAFLVAGETASCLVETGHPKDFPVIERHMNELFAQGIAPLKYLFVTHQETPHCGGLGRVLKTFPDALLCGDVSDYHLAFPQYEHRMVSMKEGDEIDLGGRSLMAVEPVIRDLRTTWWGFDTKERVLFPGDGFAYSHYHEDGHCGLVAEEALVSACHDHVVPRLRHRHEEVRHLVPMRRRVAVDHPGQRSVAPRATGRHEDARLCGHQVRDGERVPGAAAPPQRALAHDRESQR